MFSNLSAPSAFTKASSTPHEGSNYWTNEEINIIHDVVKAAHDMWDTVPEERRVATDVLFKAAEEVYAIHNIEWDSLQEHNLSKALFLIGGTSGGDLLDKFRSVMEKNGVEIEFSEGGFQSDYEDDTVPHNDQPGQGWADGEDDNDGEAERNGYDKRYEQGQGGYDNDTTSGYIFRENKYWPAITGSEKHALNEYRLARRASAAPPQEIATAVAPEPAARYAPRDPPITELEEWDMGGNGSSLPSELVSRKPQLRPNWKPQGPIPSQTRGTHAPLPQPSRPQLYAPSVLPSGGPASSRSNTPFGGSRITDIGLGISTSLQPSLGPQPDVPPSVETDASPQTVESLEQEHPVASDTTVQLDDGAFATSSPKSATSEPQLFSHDQPPRPAPPSNPAPQDTLLVPPRLPPPKKTVSFKSPTPSPESSPSVSRTTIRRPSAEEEEAESDHDVDDADILESDSAEQAYREGRAKRAHLIFLLQTVLERWDRFAEEKYQRTSVARRHMLRFRYFKAWRAITQTDENEAGSADDSTITARGGHSELPEEEAGEQYSPVANADPGSHYRDFAERRATQWWHDRLRMLSVRAWSGWADEKTALHRQATGKITNDHFDALCTLLAPDNLHQIDPGVQVNIWRPRMNLAIDSWEERASALVVADTMGWPTSSVVMSAQLKYWRKSGDDERKAHDEFVRWTQDSVMDRLHALIHRYPSPNGTVARPQTPPPESPRWDVVSGETDPAAREATTRQFENIIADRCLTYWFADCETARHRQHGCNGTCTEFAAHRALDTWVGALAREDRRVTWARRGDWYLAASRAIEHWGGSIAEARRERDRNAFLRVKRTCRARRVKRALGAWVDFLKRCDDDNQLVGQHYWVSGWDSGSLFLERWANAQAIDDDGQDAAGDLFLQRRLENWRDAYEDMLPREADVLGAWGPRVKQCLDRWNLMMLQLNGRERMVADAAVQYDRKLLRSVLGYMSGTQQQNQTQPTPARTPVTAIRNPIRRMVIHRKTPAPSPAPAAPAPWSAPTLPIRSRPPREPSKRSPAEGRIFEAGDPDAEEGQESEEDAGAPVPPPAAEFSRSLGPGNRRRNPAMAPRTPAVGSNWLPGGQAPALRNPQHTNTGPPRAHDVK